MVLQGEDDKLKLWKKILQWAIIALIVFSMFVDYHRAFQYTYTQSYQVRLEENATQVASSIRQKINDAVTTVETIAPAFSIYEDIHCEEAMDMLKKISQESEFTRMWLTKASGEALSSEGNPSDASGRDYLEDALEGNSGISKLQNSRVNGERNVVIYAPIYHSNEIVGLVIGIFKIDELLGIIDINCFGRSDYCKMLDGSGEVILEGVSSGEDFTIGSYDYVADVGISDWQIYIQMPTDIIVEDLKSQGFFYILICIKLILLVVYFILARNNMKKSMLEKMATTDSLTSILNRRAMEEKVDYHLIKHAEQRHFLLIFDVDKFKSINDTLGHLAGDNLIKVIAGELRKQFEDIAFIGRLGGDEFSVFIPNVKNMTEINKRVDRFFRNIDMVQVNENVKISISLSGGMAAAPYEGKDFEGLYNVADNKMYHAKEEKGNSIFMGDIYI